MNFLQRMRNQNNHTRDLYLAAINNNTVRVRELLDLGVNPNDISQSFGHSALHGASLLGHVDVVNILLENGADPQIRCNINTFGYQGIQKTALEVCQEAGQKNRDQVSALLGARPDPRIEEINHRIEQYKKEHASSGPETKDFLLEVGGNFASQDARGKNAKPNLVKSGKDALKYIHDAVYHITICSLEAETLNPTSDKYKNVTDTAFLLMQSVSACAHYIYHRGELANSDEVKNNPNHPEFVEANSCKKIVQNSSGIDWESLSRFSRLQEYDPSFISKIEYHTKSDIIGGFICLPEIRHELDNMMTACRYLRRYDEYKTTKNKKFLPNVSRLSGFFEDEYYVQHIEKALKNWSNNRDEDFTNVGSKERFLRDVIIIGEALKHLSPVATGRFNPDSVSRLKKARLILCHAENGINRAAIEQILSGGSSIITDRRLGFDQLEQDMLSLRDGILEQQSLYCDKIRKEDILLYGSDQVLKTEEPQDKNKSKVKDKAESRKDLEERLKVLKKTPNTHLTKQELEEIKSIKKKFIKEKFEKKLLKLRTEFANKHDFKFDPHNTQDFNNRLDDPLNHRLTKKTNETLKQNKDSYELALEKQSRAETLTQDEDKLLKDYNNTKQKLKKWEEYASDKQKLKEDEESKLLEVETLHKIQLLERTIALSKFCKDQMIKVKHYFGDGFGEQPNFSHEVLEFYQIMAGSAARGLLDHEHFQKLAPENLKKIFKENLQPSRGYLAHIGVREGEKTVTESLSRSDVFGGNSKKTSEAILILEDVIKIMELGDSHRTVMAPSTSVEKTFYEKMASKIGKYNEI